MDFWTDIYPLAVKATTSSRPSSRASTIRPSSASPSYTHANPFIDSTSAHSLTHPCSTHSLAACARCKPVDIPTIERTLVPFGSYEPPHEDSHDRIHDKPRDTGLSKSTTASRLLQKWGTFKTWGWNNSSTATLPHFFHLQSSRDPKIMGIRWGTTNTLFAEHASHNTDWPLESISRSGDIL
jgi:hypothetical protein